MKLSKKAAKEFELELWQALENIDPESLRALAETGHPEGLVEVWPEYHNKMDRQRQSRRRRLLFELVNLYDPEKLPIVSRQLLDSFRFNPPPSGGLLAQLQKLLRHIWRRELPAGDKQLVVNLLFEAATRCNRGRVHPTLAFQSMEFMPDDFIGQIISGILENWLDMAKCANPDCQQAYFWAKRVTQIYCERGECTRYALRKKSLEYWRRKHGKSTEGEVNN